MSVPGSSSNLEPLRSLSAPPLPPTPPPSSSNEEARTVALAFARAPARLLPPPRPPTSFPAAPARPVSSPIVSPSSFPPLLHGQRQVEILEPRSTSLFSSSREPPDTHSPALPFDTIQSSSERKPERGRGSVSAQHYPTIQRHYSDSRSSSNDADVHYRYSRHFPPLLPTIATGSDTSRHRKALTNKIASKISLAERMTSNDAESRELSGSPGPGVELKSAASETESSSDEDEVQIRWSQLKEQRQCLNGTKREMKGRRERLRDLRREKDKSDNAFLGLIRPIIAKSRRGAPTWPEQLLNDQFARMQALRTEYYSLESEYESFEIALDEQEDSLNELEVRFFSTLASERPGTTRATRASLSSASEQERSNKDEKKPPALLGISHNGPKEDDHPYWRDLMSALGDYNLAVEDLEDLLIRRDYAASRLEIQRKQIAYEREVRQDIERQPDEEDEEFMAAFPLEEEEKDIKVQEKRGQMRELQRLCKLHGVEKEHPSDAVVYALDGTAFQNITLDVKIPTPKTLERPRFSVLLSQPEHLLREHPLTPLQYLRWALQLHEDDPDKERWKEDAMKEYGIDQLVHSIHADGDDVGDGDDLSADLVNRWLLYKLRTSPLEAQQLALTFSHTAGLRILDFENWQADVLRFWWDDCVQGRPTPNQASRASLQARIDHDSDPG